MYKQFKWYKIDSKDCIETQEKIKNNLDFQISKITDTEILVEYEYDGKHDYKNLLESMNNYKTSQKIITTNKFYFFLKESLLSQNIEISKIKFLDCLREETKIIEKYIKEANKTKSNEKIEELIDELKWLKGDGIDIQYIEFNDFSQTLIYKFQIFSNGVILIDNEKIILNVLNFLERSI